MKVLAILDDKIQSLVSLVKDLKKENEMLRADVESLKEENEELKAENAKLAEDNAQLTTQLESVEGAVSKDTEVIQGLQSEQRETKSVLDDLIKSIDAIVEQENQQ